MIEQYSSQTQHVSLTAGEADAGQRSDAVIARELGIARSLAVSLCRESHVQVNGRP